MGAAQIPRHVSNPPLIPRPCSLSQAASPTPWTTASVSSLLCSFPPAPLQSFLHRQPRAPSQSLKMITSFPGSQFFSHFPQLPGKGHTPRCSLKGPFDLALPPSVLSPPPPLLTSAGPAPSLPSTPRFLVYSLLLLTLRVSAKISPPDTPPDHSV